MGIVLKISKPTFNVLTETDPQNLIFDDSLNSLKTAGSGSISQVVGAHSTVLVTVAHGQSFIPMMLGFFRDSSDSKWFITMSQPSSAALSRPSTSLNVSHAVDATNIYFLFGNSSGSSVTIELLYEFFFEGN